jgi:VanZ family protein
MLMAPAPREWGAFGKWISPYYDYVGFIFQPAAHITLMAIGVILLMRNFSHRSPGWAFLISAATAMLLAMAFEILQSVLPSGFARQYDAGDLIPSLAGALIGGMIGIYRYLNHEDENE